MFRWMPYAMVRVTLFFAGGVLFCILRPSLVGEKELWIITTSLLTFYFSAFFFFDFDVNKSLRGFLGLTSVFCLGYLHVILKTDSNDPGHFLHVTRPVRFYRALLTSYPEEKERSWKQEARIIQAETDIGWISTKGKILLYFSKVDSGKPYRYGDVLLVRGSPQEISSPPNPGEFDFKRFLSHKKIYYQHFIRKDDVRFLKNDPPNRFIQAAIIARTWADQVLKDAVHGKREQATASALILGVTDGLDNELLRAYASTGSLHVLAVSGLHVSIIYWIILLLFKRVDRWVSGKWMLAVGSVIVLWAYAFITGLSPSVLRAVTMFTFVAFARPWKQSTNIYNTLAASAFCLLLFEPYLLMSVGFQLSYVAVFGIVWLQPRVYMWWEPHSRLLDEVWKISSVSIAAQIATFPIGLLYFHQFPNYFLISNLLVIPASFVVLVVGITILPLSLVPLAAVGLGYLLTWAIRAMNYFVFAVEALPFSLLENIYIDAPQCLLLATGIASMTLLLVTRKFQYLVLGFLSAIMFSGFQWNHFFDHVHQEKITVYRIPGHSGLDLIQNGHSTFFSDSTLSIDQQMIRFHIQPNRQISGVRRVFTGSEHLMKLKGVSVMAWNGRTILHIVDRNAKLPFTATVDWILISNNAIRSIGQLRQINCKKIIIDSSNSSYFADQLVKEAERINIEIYSVVRQGAFEFSL